MLSLNEVSGFSVEDLEPRMEMQMLGLGSHIIHFRNTYVYIFTYTTTNGRIKLI
jgi:hypothetical protein